MDSTRNFSILHPLMQNYHVLRHPGIKKELEERAAAEGRLLSDELSNKIKEELPVTNDQSGADNEKCSQFSELTSAEKGDTNTNHTSVGTFDSTTVLPGGSTGKSTDKMENVTNEDSNALAACMTTSFSRQNTNNSYLVPKGSIQQRKCYIPTVRSNGSEGNSDSKEENNKFHMKYFRTQPGRKCAAKLDQEEKVRKLATLALFGHTFPRPDIAGVIPHAVAVNGFKRHHLKVLSKLNNGVDSDSSLSYGSLRAISKKNRKSKFPRICLSGKTASELLARSPVCTESSSSETDDEDDDCGNNNTLLQPKKIQLNSKELKRIKTLKSKSLLGSLPKLKKKKSDTGEKEDEKEEEDFACHYCDRTFTTKSGLGWHESYSHPRTCRICAKSFQFSNRWTRHKDPICNPCSEKFPQPKGSPIKVSASLSHYNPQQLTEKQKLYYRFKCDICSKLFGKRDRMIKHITNNHPSDMHKVDLAKFVFSPKKVTVGGNCYGGGYSGTATKCTPAGIMEQ